MTLTFKFRENLFRIWYWYVNKVDKNAEILFMNYGYADKDKNIDLDKQNESNRYSIQLYDLLAKGTEIKDKDIVEVGCGRGGGLSYISNSFNPATAKGIDLDKRAVTFCNRYYDQHGLSFLQGDAQNLSLKNNTCDVIINVESSHRYQNMKAFLNEVFRVLRPGGHFLFTDFRYDYEIEDMKKELESSGLTVVKEEFITKEVVAALELDDERRRRLVKKLAPKFLHKVALDFAGTVGSETYNQFASGKYVYFNYILKK